MAIKANLIIDQGSDWATEFNLTDANNEIIELNGYTGAGQIRKYYTSSTKYDFNVLVEGLTGRITLSMDANTTGSIIAGRYVYDVELTSNTGIQSRIVEGIVTVTPQVTK